RSRADEAELLLIGESGKQRAAISHSDHLPEIVAVDEIAVLIDRLCLEHEGAGGDEVRGIALTRAEDDVPRLIGDGELHPRLDDVEWARGEIVSGLVVREHRAK